VIIRQKERQLGKVIRVRLTDHPSRSLSITLEPTGRILGRLLDRQDTPIAGAAIEALLQPSEDFGEQLPTTTTDAQGRFEYTDVPIGCSYDLYAHAAGMEGRARFAKDVAIEPGETKDLGDVTFGGAANEDSAKQVDSTDTKPSSTAISTGKPKTTILRGQVLLPDGKPAAGAELYWTEIELHRFEDILKAVPRGTTNDKGRFEITLSESDLPATRTLQTISARKAGYGIAWQRIARKEIPDDITLRLAQDLPIRGQVLDTEGRPVIGAKVSLARIQASRNDNLDAFLLAWKQSWHDAEYTKLDEPGAFYANFDPLDTVTNEEGRFEILGAGVERLAFVEIRATGYAYDQLHVVTRQSFDADSYNTAWSHLAAPHRGERAKLAGPQIEHVMTAELIVRGKVLTGDREPVAGATLWLGQFGFAPAVSTVSDASGSYELRGHPRSVPVSLSVGGPEGSQFLNRMLERETAPTQTTLDIDVELNRGVVIEGRVFDQTDGKGVRAVVHFEPLPENGFADQGNHYAAGTQTDAKGHFRLLVMPGPGVLNARVHHAARIADHDISPYRQASFSAADSQRVPTTINGDDRYYIMRGNSIWFLSAENAVKFVDLAPDSNSVTCDLPVDPGKTVAIQIEDEQGGSVKDAFVSGLADTWPNTFRLADPSCTIYGLGSDRPRRVCLLHPEWRLAASIVLTGDEQGPVKVRLAASASMSGRALAPDGQPLADALVQINYAGRSASELVRFSELEHAPVKTDSDGRFLADNIVPGEPFSLDFKLGSVYLRAELTNEQRQLKAGQQLELGDMKVKQL
jgi:protocatechuate 3,4-dioxygenase beta subunit